MTSFTGPDWPPHYQYGTIIGKYETTDGQPQVGSITFDPRPDVVYVAGDETIISAVTITVALDEHGAFSVELPSTDDPDVNPTGWTYEVTEEWPRGRTYDIPCPMNTTTNIGDVSPLQPSIGVVNYVGPPGPPGPSPTVIDGGTP